MNHHRLRVSPTGGSSPKSCRPRRLGLLRAWRTSLLLGLVCTLAGLAPAQDRILFIQGGFGTGGFLEGGANEQLSDIFSMSVGNGNHAYGELGLLLLAEGFTLQQLNEGPVMHNTPVDLAALDLSTYRVIVFGSNNAPYSEAAADLIADWICQGGSALFISDANWGSDWSDAPNSDQTFLDHFDLIMNQDTGQYGLERAAGDFVVGGVDQGGHPILAGPDGQLGTTDDVDVFDGEGVSPLTVVDLLPNVDPIVLAGAEGNIHVNDAVGSGSMRPATDADGALVVLEYGTGRIAGHFDRNTFFNQNGAGTDLTNGDNAQYARNLFSWLAAAPGVAYGTGCAGAGGFVPRLDLVGCPRAGDGVRLILEDGPGGASALLLFGLTEGSALLPAGCPILIDPVLDGLQLVLPLGGVAPGEGGFDIPATIPADFPVVDFTLQAFIPGGGPAGQVITTNGVRVRVF